MLAILVQGHFRLSPSLRSLSPVPLSIQMCIDKAWSASPERILVTLTTQNRLQKIAATVAALVAITMPSVHPGIAKSGSGCAVFDTPQVSPALVTLRDGATASVYKRGKPIYVTLTLRAGAKGVYLPDFFGPFQETCSHGFAAAVLDFHGRAADPTAAGCAYAGGPPKIRYVRLKPKESRTWSTYLSTESILPGRYCLYAEYLISELLISSALNLPDDKALVARGRIVAPPLTIEIR